MAGWYCAGKERTKESRDSRGQIHFARAGLEQSCDSFEHPERQLRAMRIFVREEGSFVCPLFDLGCNCSSCDHRPETLLYFSMKARERGNRQHHGYHRPLGSLKHTVVRLVNVVLRGTDWHCKRNIGFKARSERGFGQRACEGDDSAATWVGVIPGIKRKKNAECMCVVPSSCALA